MQAWLRASGPRLTSAVIGAVLHTSPPDLVGRLAMVLDAAHSAAPHVVHTHSVATLQGSPVTPRNSEAFFEASRALADLLGRAPGHPGATLTDLVHVCNALAHSAR